MRDFYFVVICLQIEDGTWKMGNGKPSSTMRMTMTRTMQVWNPSSFVGDSSSWCFSSAVIGLVKSAWPGGEEFVESEHWVRGWLFFWVGTMFWSRANEESAESL